MRCGWVTEQSLSFFTFCFIWLTSMCLVKLLAIETITLSFHRQKYTLPLQRKSNILRSDFFRLFVSIKTFDAPCVRFSQKFQLLLLHSYQDHLKVITSEETVKIKCVHWGYRIFYYNIDHGIYNQWSKGFRACFTFCLCKY